MCLLCLGYLRRFRSFGVQGALLRTFIDAVVASAMEWSAGAAVCQQLTGGDRLIRKASAVLGCPLDTVQVVGERRMVLKLSSMMDNESHPMQDTVSALSRSFGDRLLHPKCVKEWFRRSFLPAVVRLYNQHCFK